jgi:hypothetical protein
MTFAPALEVAAFAAMGVWRGPGRAPLRSILLLLLCVGLSHPGRASAAPCREADGIAIFASPRDPQPGRPLRVIVVAEKPFDATVTILDPAGDRVAETTAGGSGASHWYAETVPRRAGAHRATLQRGPEVLTCREIWVGRDDPGAVGDGPGVWRVREDWSPATEDLFSAWIERLFADPLDAEPSWRSLHEVTRDPERNLLHDHLGLGEDDEGGLRLEPDCADLPYFLRSYFAWKLGLPFGYFDCSRGTGGQPPRCGRWHSNLDADVAPGSPLGRMQAFLHAVADTAQSGAGRTPADDDRTDFYPTRLEAGTLRAGTVYADPYGHTLIVVGRLAQTETHGGVLLAVDAQPDGTVARKRYWRGNFLHALDPALGSAGFKRFRPVVRSRSGLRPLDNAEVSEDPAYGDFSLEQGSLNSEDFYERVDAVLSPRPLDPERAMVETIDALDEQVRARVRSVANGEDHVARQPGVIAMPEGAAIFETVGAWEDFATPSRDLRLLIAIDTVRAFPERLRRRPDRFTIPAGRSAGEVRADLEALLAREASSRHFDYIRSDGSTWTLSLASVLERAPELEIAYNPNDCVEVRWGAVAGGEEAETCRRRAPRDQAGRMEQVRDWFRERRRPPR